MPRRAGVESEVTKAQLIEAAAAAFAERGYDGARVADIARAAGLTTGAIYAHYPNKAELLLEALRAHSDTALATLISENRDAALLDLLATMGMRIIVQPADTSQALLVEALCASRREPALAEVMVSRLANREARTARFVEVAQRSGEVDPDLPPSAVARLISLIALGSLLSRAIGVEPIDADDWSAVITRVVDAARPSERHQTSTPTRDEVPA